MQEGLRGEMRFEPQYRKARSFSALCRVSTEAADGPSKKEAFAEKR
jgi:hypothetical protein